MKTRYLAFLFVLIPILLLSQQDWQEHFSHDRRAYAHLGHLIAEDHVILIMGNQNVPMNTIETIVGNSPKIRTVLSNYFTYESKRTMIGIDRKEVLLIKPFDYDIAGFGAHSIHNKDDYIKTRSIQPDQATDPNGYIMVQDAFLIGEQATPKHCIDYEKRYTLNEDDDVLTVSDLDTPTAFHTGLAGDGFIIQDGIISKLDTGTATLEIGSNYGLHNDPFRNELIKIEGQILRRFQHTDFAHVANAELDHSPELVQPTPDGLYYLIESDESFTIYRYNYEDSETDSYYTLSKEAALNYRVYDFEVQNDYVYFFGLLSSNLINQGFSYVQKRQVGKNFNPERRDLELTEVKVQRIMEQFGYRYDYTLKVTNVGQDTAHHFTVYSNELYSGFGPEQFEQKTYFEPIPPNQTIEVEGSFNYSHSYDQLSFHIVGVDYGLDSDESNNTYTAEVFVLSTDNADFIPLVLSPNPAIDYIELNAPISYVENIKITDVNGQVFKTYKGPRKTFDISELPKGQYWLELGFERSKKQLPFIKI